jgi:hypothetical protein
MNPRVVMVEYVRSVMEDIVGDTVVSNQFVFHGVGFEGGGFKMLVKFERDMCARFYYAIRSCDNKYFAYNDVMCCTAHLGDHVAVFNVVKNLIDRARAL